MKENVQTYTLINTTGEIMTSNMENDEVLNSFFPQFGKW